MSDRVVLALSVRESVTRLGSDDRARARKALFRIGEDPFRGVPLSPPVDGCWSLRDGALRIVYRLVPETGSIAILRLGTVEESSS